ncbi:hypothetical protein DFH06DRAFT_1169011 [Mycena polygramma]|nr:hypothetical protein DFH06DRAFT_1169011 [Mycena polygramma]
MHSARFSSPPASDSLRALLKLSLCYCCTYAAFRKGVLAFPRAHYLRSAISSSRRPACSASACDSLCVLRAYMAYAASLKWDLYLTPESDVLTWLVSRDRFYHRPGPACPIRDAGAMGSEFNMRKMILGLRFLASSVVVAFVKLLCFESCIRAE